MGSDPTPAELVAIGLALGALAAFVQQPLARLRAWLSGGGRASLAWVTYPAAASLLLAALAAAAVAGPLAASSFVVGLLGTRTLVIGDG